MKTYTPGNEKRYAKHLLTHWYFKPNLKNLDTDVNAIASVKAIARCKIITNNVPVDAYQVIQSAILDASKHAWEILISDLSRMTKHFEDFRKLVIAMLADHNLKIRETSLLVMEDGRFSKPEKQKIYTGMLSDKSKKIRIRVIDMIGRESAKFRKSMKTSLLNFQKIENDKEVLENFEYVLNMK